MIHTYFLSMNKTFFEHYCHIVKITITRSGFPLISAQIPATGALDGGSPCRMSNLRNVNVARHLNGDFPCRLLGALMSHVEFKKYPMSCPLHYFSYH